jgi:hypothetical protein
MVLLTRSAGGRIGRPGGGAPCGLPLVGLDPDQRVDQVCYLYPPGTVTCDDQQRAAGWIIDGSLPAMLVPSRRPVADRPALVDRYQDPVNQQVGPAEAGMLSGNVVSVDDDSSRHHVVDPRRHRGLAVVAASIHGQHGRTARTAAAWPLFGYCSGDGA